MTFQDLNHSPQPPKFCLLFGKNLRTSYSKKIHNFWFKKFSLNVKYENHILYEPHDFIQAIEGFIVDSNFVGGNITMPFKQLLIDGFQNRLMVSNTVKNTASSNTLFRDKTGLLKIENTDVIGIKKTLIHLCSNKSFFDNAIVLGGGGSSASCIYSLYNTFKSVQIYCITRNPEKTRERFSKSTYLLNSLKDKYLKTETLNRNFLHTSCSTLQKIYQSSEPLLIINTLPLGATKMYKESNHYAINLLKLRVNKPTYFFDLVYHETDACRTAKSLKFPYMNGTYMLKEQARESFKLWTGIRP